MTRRTIRRALTLLTPALVATAISVAQSPNSSASSANATDSSWQAAQSAVPSKGKIFVVTVDQPDRRQSCRIQSFAVDKLVCFRAMGGARTYLPQQVVAIILPGDGHLKLRALLVLNGALGAAIWGTVVLAAPCPACAVATGVVALVVFGAAGAIAIGDDQPDRLLYLAPGQHLSSRLGFVQL